jgi:biopolymer transport protein ExbB
MLLSIILQAVNAAGNAVKQAELPQMSTEQTGTIWQSIEKGGIIMIPIGILFVMAIYIFIERILVIRNSTRKEGNFIADVKKLVEQKKINDALQLCEKTESPLGRMLEKAIKRIGRPIKEIEDSVEVEGRFEVFDLEKGLPILSAIAGIAPMLGFLGTILGVIKIFSDIAVTSDVSIGTVSAGLYVKMVSSAAGLLVGIVAYVFYNWLNVRIGKIVNKMERNAIGFIDFLKDSQENETAK